MIADAQATLRGAVETLFHAVALVRKPDLLERLREHDDAEKRKQVEKMFQHKDSPPLGRHEVLSSLELRAGDSNLVGLVNDRRSSSRR